MSFLDYIKDKIILIFINLLIFMLLSLFVFLYIPSPVLFIVMFLIWICPMFTFIIIDYFKKASFYKSILSNIENLDRKYLISSIIKEPDFTEGRILYEILKVTDKSMHENINKYKNLQKEYREYIEAWVHEIKTPIASGKLIIENHQNPTTLSLKEEFEKIEEFVEEALFYSRSNSVDRDYIVKAFPLQHAINSVIRKNSKYFIQNNIKLNITNIESVIYSDIKWVQFILNQVIGNAIKYRNPDKPIISIYSEENPHNINLYIVDNGVGINEKDIDKIFDKGFTGHLGRVHEKSTGMGLYLTKKLCTKLNLNITASSTENLGTEICIIFPKSKMMLFEE